MPFVYVGGNTLYEGSRLIFIYSTSRTPRSLRTVELVYLYRKLWYATALVRCTVPCVFLWYRTATFPVLYPTVPYKSTKSNTVTFLVPLVPYGTVTFPVPYKFVRTYRPVP